MGTQVVVQAKNVSRVPIQFTAEASPGATADAVLTLTQSKDGAASTTGTSWVIPVNKRWRLTSFNAMIENTLGTNPKRARVRLRHAPAGTVATNSPVQTTLCPSVSGTLNTSGQPAFIHWPDGLEYIGDGVRALGITADFPDWVTAAQTGTIYITLSGFEYAANVPT